MQLIKRDPCTRKNAHLEHGWPRAGLQAPGEGDFAAFQGKMQDCAAAETGIK